MAILKTRPEKGFCRHRNAKKQYDCGASVPTEHPDWSWCSTCVKAHREAQKAAKAKTTKKVTMKVTTKVAKTEPKDDAARAAVSCTRCNAEAGTECVWGKAPSKRVHADRLRLFEATTSTK